MSQIEVDRAPTGMAVEFTPANARITTKDIDSGFKQRVRGFFNALADHRAGYRNRNRYYHEQLLRHFRFIIPPGKRLVEIGCADGELLRQLKPSYGVGIDFSPAMIRAAESRRTDADENLHFEQGDVESITFREKFDFIVISDVLGCLSDIQQAMENLRSACHERTRIVISYHRIMWDPALRAAQAFGLKMPQPHTNWLSSSDIVTLGRLAGFEVVRMSRFMLAPKYLPVLSNFLNRFIAPLPGINALCMLRFVVLRPVNDPAPPQDLSTTIIVPCRNERGNIRECIQRIPGFGGHQEIIFVDGHSTDGTVKEIERVIAENPDQDIKLLAQEGTGKGNAVRLGFAKATGDILMILDADLTVPPEDLPKFYNAIASKKGEFINGSRLVYPMERQAMRFLNILGNKFFGMVLSWLLDQRLKDTLCGTKVLRRGDYERIAANRAYFGEFDPFGDFDLLFGAAKQNMKILEVPIRYRDRTYGTTSISRFMHGWLLLRMSL
ncbi:MAG: glycosyltransferase, partial [Planctomycetota bacterium]|nr:glycosyltransferase [Planctomycetota bacterium]